MVTRSPARTRMRLRRSLPARWASTTRSCSSCTLNKPLGNFSNTTPVTSILSSLLIQPFPSGGLSGPANRFSRRRRPVCRARSQLFWSGSHGDVCSLQTLGTARHFELNSGPFVQASIALRLNRGEVYEYIFAVLSLNEAIPLGCVKPLHCAFFFHLCFLYAVMRTPLARPPNKAKGGCGWPSPATPLN